MPISDFTLEAYGALITCIHTNGYTISNYTDPLVEGRSCILRHDVDFSLEMAANFAEHEQSLPKPARSTYFVLTTSDFYNPFSRAGSEAIKRIIVCGHEVGLHFDEAQYAARDPRALIPPLLAEAERLAQVIGCPVKTVSMHRPSKMALEANLEIPGMVNSYSERFFKEYKYLSDSRMCWREDAEEVVSSGQYDRLHILAHPFWYAPAREDTRTKLLSFIQRGMRERYFQVKENFRNLDEFVQEQDITEEIKVKANA